MYSRVTSFPTQLICLYFFIQKTEKQRNRKISWEKYGMIDFGENIIIIWILDKSGSVAPATLEIKLVSP